MGREVEWKYRCPEAQFDTIREAFSGWQTITMETAYFDTPDGALEKRRWMLRRRLENGRAVTTVKIPLPDGSRGEWETGCSWDDAIEELCNLGAPLELKQMAQRGFGEVCAARFVRLAALVSLPGCSVELALDRGSFLGSGAEQPFSELEVELKDGDEEKAREFAQSLAETYNLEPEEKGKAQRAMALRKTT